MDYAASHRVFTRRLWSASRRIRIGFNPDGYSSPCDHAESGTNKRIDQGALATPCSTIHARLTDDPMPAYIQLAGGTLNLEGSPQALTSEQVRQMLAGFPAMQSVNANPNVKAEDFSAVLEELQSYMTAEQISAISDMSLSVPDIVDTMNRLGIAFEFQGFGGGGNPSDGGWGGANAHVQIPIGLMDYLVQLIQTRAGS